MENKMKKLPFLGVCLSLTALLVGCGGGGSSSSSSNDGPATGGSTTPATAASGLYLGTITQTNSAGEERTGDSTLLLTPATAAGNARFIEQAPNTYAKGTFEFADSSKVTGTLKEFQLGRPLAEGILDGSSTRTSIKGESFATDGSKLNSFQFDRVPQLSDLGSSIGSIDGDWTDTRNTSAPAIAIVIDGNGGISGGDGTCNFTGTVKVPNPAINLYQIDYAASGCGDDADYPKSGFSGDEKQGNYVGLAYRAPASGNDPERLVFLADNDKISRSYVFQ